LGLQDAKGGVLVPDVVPGGDAAHRGLANGDIILHLDKDVTASPDEVWKAINAERSEKHEFTMMLVLQKHPRSPGAEWAVLRLREPAG
jgi:S1-C subfamily serine protease